MSVVIPAYNAETLLPRALESVFSQTLPPDEILVVDDGSKDGTHAVAQSFGSRVRVLSQANAGASAARNLGVQSATSEWIAFLDADDAWEPRKLERQRSAIAGLAGTVLCYTGVMALAADGSRTLVPAVPPSRLRAALRLTNPILPSSVLLSRSAFLHVGGFNVSQIVCEDWDLWLRLLQRGPFCVVDEPLTVYQTSITGLSSDADELFREAERMVDSRLLDGMRGLNRFLWRRRILSYQAYKSALTARAAARRESELAYMLRSLSLWPFPTWHPVRYKTLGVTLRNRLR